jgi:pyruvate/2-oxoglutarate dehydrogenase complex dihydrolipoamide dehydrogenase (E3) component
MVLGGGPIAVEMAQAFCRLGSKVEVIQRSGQILSKEDPDLAQAVRQQLEAEGVKFHLNTSLKEVRKANGHKEVVFEQDGREVVARGAEILVSLGRRPNLEGLNLEGIGVEYTKKGLKLDERLRTSLSHIYGAGDVTGAHQFTHAAGYEGGVVLANAVFRLPRKASYTHMPHATYCQPELASVGLNEKAAKAAGVEYTLWEESFKDSDRALAEGAPQGKIKLLLDARQKPLGVQILGPSAGELLSEWVAVLGGGVKLSSLASAVHPYPTLAEINKKVAGKVLSEKLFSDRVKKGLKLFFSLKGRATCE